MQTLLRRITISIGTGAALAASSIGCATSRQRTNSSEASDSSVTSRNDGGDTNDATIDSGVSTASNDSGGVSDPDSSAAMGDGAAPLPPFPLDGLNTLQDPCCYDARCYAIAGSCPELDVWQDPNPEFQPECERRGPYATNPDYPFTPYPDADGNCCYLVPVVCFFGDGRPFTTDGTHQVAPVIMRNDWLLV